MLPLRPVILALLLALAGPAAAIPSSAPMAQSSMTTTADNQVYAPTNTSAVMTLGEDADETRAFATASVDVGTTLAIEKDSVNRRLDSRAFETQFSHLESEEAQRDLVFKYATQIQSRTEVLERREQTARQGFRNGSLSAGEYVQTLARIDEATERLRDEVRLVDTYSARTQFPLNDYLGSLEKRLLSLSGPVRNDAALAFTGQSSASRVYVEAAGNGYVLSKIEEGVYTREVYRNDHRNMENDGHLDDTSAEQIISQTYPWAYENKGSSRWNGPNIKGYHTYEMGYSHGDVYSYIDTTSEVVFKDHQSKYLTTEAAQRNGFAETMPKGPGVTANESGLLLLVNRSYAGGPMYVELRDNETGEPIEGTVTVDDEVVGETTTEGGLWTLSPAGSFNVSASSGLDVVTVETRATRPIKRYNTTQD